MNVSRNHNCYGCGVCAVVCGKKLIDIRLNEDGFYEPFIANPEKCTDCGLCTEVCSFNHVELANKSESISSFAAWSKEPAVRQKCSSGGVGFELGRILMASGYKVCGVRYNIDNQRAEHFLANSVEELIQTIGSKYIQSYSVDGFKAIDRKEKYLVTGTPCQIDSFRRYIKKFHCEENFVLMDFFCHGVPSMLAWQKYVASAEKNVGKLTYVSWRNKFNWGWHDSWAMAIDGIEKGEPVDWHDSYNLLIRGKKSLLNSRLSQGDLFYKLFLSDACLGKACYDSCKYKYDQSSADVRICDLWGETYKTDEKGVSGVIVFSEKGLEWLKKCNCEFVEHPLDVVTEGQMKKSPMRPGCHNKLMITLKNKNKSIEDAGFVVTNFQKKQRWINRFKHPLRTLSNLVRRLR